MPFTDNSYSAGWKGYLLRATKRWLLQPLLINQTDNFCLCNQCEHPLDLAMTQSVKVQLTFRSVESSPQWIKMMTMWRFQRNSGSEVITIFNLDWLKSTAPFVLLLFILPKKALALRKLLRRSEYWKSQLLWIRNAAQAEEDTRITTEMKLMMLMKQRLQRQTFDYIWQCGHLLANKNNGL